MPKTTTLAERLNDAVEAMMGDREQPTAAADPRLQALLAIADTLRDLPSSEFKARLKADLQNRRAESPKVSAVPEGYHTATPCLIIRDAARAIDFYRRAFDATELVRHSDASGRILHAEIMVGDSRIAVADEMIEWGNPSPQALGGSPVILSLYVDDVDTFAGRAIAAGATQIFPVADQVYGDRAGRIGDPFGHVWIVASHQRDVSQEEMRRLMEQWAEESESAPRPPSADYVVEPYLAVPGASRLIDFAKQAFDAELVSGHVSEDGTLKHAAMRIGDSVVGMGDPSEVPVSPTALHLYVPDADAVYERALRAGATSTYPPTDQDYGDREAGVKDPLGNHWYIATHKGEGQRDLPHLPPGLHSVTSYLHPKGASALIDFLERAFEAKEVFRAQAPDGTVAHAKIRIGESVVEMGEAHGVFQPMPTIYHLYVGDVDSAYDRAIAAGGISLGSPADQTWGFRSAGVQDPAGNQWWINAPLAKTASPPAAATGEESAVSLGVTPFLQVTDVAATLEFLTAAFGAEVILFDRGGDPPHDHAELRIGESVMMMGEAYPLTTSAFYLRVADVDRSYERAIAAGAASQQPPKDMPWGDRMAHVRDAVGNSWYISGPAREKKESKN